ncbi:adenylyl cyclase [Klebsiella huaxiensis]|uniref:Fimbria/pilus periplasmic chaperone n=3 Tax=Klebsiella huaxiensis TaxID=2153354 RepID=A0ABT6EHV5_9ENTR|nr:fimbria/pilus periplasmic chaperone [Klebsiella huaxiensis]MDG1644997.1 fimbria/pilus periplasmic chaperone [Klebsiella huaxiensis]QBG06805.1 adenylyl cyclase [Klebsiella huaxiensis]
MMLATARYLRKKAATGLVAVALGLLPLTAVAEGGISIQGTRIIYPAGAKQTTVNLSNSSKTDTFLVQSWVENADGKKSPDFVVTPPLYVSKPENGNTLRLMYTGGPLPQDRETLYYFIAKAIPSVSREATEGKNSLILASANRIKLFVRPAGLKPALAEAPEMLTFRKSGGQLEISNPSPYYLTLTDVKAGSQKLNTLMVPPKGKTRVALPAGSGSSVSYRTISDHGALTPEISRSVN